MKTAKSIIVVLFVLLTAQIASAYYCPSTGHWLSRDPIGEPGFQIQQLAAQLSAVTSNRWINRDPIGEQGKREDTATAFLNALGIKSRLSKPNVISNPDANQSTANLYGFVGNDPVVNIDKLGLFTSSCASAAPLKSTDCACDAYGSEQYPLLGVSLKCFCKCAGDSAWSQAVRGCLACSHAKGDDITDAHIQCYAAATAKYGLPPLKIGLCYFQCGGILPVPPIPPIYPGSPPMF